MTQQAIPDHNQRNQALNPERSFIVQAPAGSGKTTLLAQRYVHLLTRVQRPEEILAITFTKKAAGEMRHRVLSLLHQDSAQARLIRDRSDQRDWQLFENPNVLKIQTIDSFALEIASQTPYLQNAAGLSITEYAAQYYEQAATQLIGRLYSDNPSNYLIAEFVAFLDNDAAKAVRLLSHMLGRRDQWLAAVTAVATNNDEALTATLLEDAISALRSNIRDQLEQRFIQDDEQMLITLADILGLDHNWTVILPVLLTKSGKLRKRLTVKDGIDDAEQKRNFNQWLESLRERELESLIVSLVRAPSLDFALAKNGQAGQLKMLHLCCVCLALAAAELDQLLNATGTLDFTGLLLRAKQALRDESGPTDLALYLDYRIRHILVDEYQDTSRAQYEFFNLLTETWQSDDSTTFFVVGDPMQSIYRFRDADVSIFADSREQGLDNVPLASITLEANFRSDPTVVSWCNGLFESLFRASHATQLGEVSFSPAVPMVPATQGADVHCVRFSDVRDENQHILRHVQALLAQDSDTEIAVLCRARTHLTVLLEVFSAAGIAIQATDMDLLSNRHIIRDLMSLHGLLLQPGERLNWFSVLRSPMFGLDLRQLTTLADDIDMQTAISDRSRELPQLERLQLALAWARSRLYEVPLREVMEGLWFRCGGASAYAAEEWPHANAWFDLIDELQRDAYDHSILAQALNTLFATTELTARVQIMTIHKAKGLEFDHVIVPFLDRRARSDTAQLLLWRAGAKGLLMGVRGDEVHDWLAFEESERSTNEEKRLLYVACTRAKQSLFTSFSCDPEKQPGGLAKWLAHLAEDVPHPEGSPEPTDTFGNQGDLFQVQHLERLPADYRWAPPEYSSIGSFDVDQSRRTDDQISSRYEVALGLLIHRALAWYATTSQPDLTLLSRRLEVWAREMALDTTEHPTLLTECSQQIDQTLSDPNGRWLLNQHSEGFSELPLTGVYHGVLTRVVLDRTFVDSSTRWIVDFKTGQPHGDEKLTSFIDREATRYAPQLHKYRDICGSIYSEPIKTALYFTALNHLEVVGSE